MRNEIDLLLKSGVINSKLLKRVEFFSQKHSLKIASTNVPDVTVVTQTPHHHTVLTQEDRQGTIQKLLLQ